MFLQNLFESIARTGKSDTAVIGWGRGMGHKGHMMLASSVITKAKSLGGDPYFVVSRTVGKDDPITPEEKLAIYKKVFPQQGHIFQAASDQIPDLTRVLTNLNQQGYKNAIVVVGSDQVAAFQYLKKYNGKPDKAGNIAFQFDKLDVISRQETGDPSADQEGPRATPMRQVLLDPSKSEQEQFAIWRRDMPDNLSDEEVIDLMRKAKQRMMSQPKGKTLEGLDAASVRSIQVMLNKKGANLDVDGKLGPLTVKSIKKFFPKASSGSAPEPSKTTAVQGKRIKEMYLAELDKPSGKLYIIVRTDQTNNVRVVGDFATFPEEVMARSTRVGIKDKEGRKERPLKVNFLMTDARQALAELNRALKDVDFIGGEAAEFVFKESALKSEIGPQVKQLAKAIEGGIDERYKLYTTKDVGTEPDSKPKGVNHYVIDPMTGKSKLVPKPGKPSSQMGGHATVQPQTFKYTLQRTELMPKLRSMGFKFDGNQIVLTAKQRDQLVQKLGPQWQQIFGKSEKFTEKMMPKSHFAGSHKNKLGPAAHLKGKMKRPARKGDLVGDAQESQTFEEKVIENLKKKRNPTRDHLRQYPVSDKDVAKPVKKPEKKKPEQGVAEAVPFSYGFVKPPRKGSVAYWAEKKRKEQEKGKPPIEPKDQMVGVAKVTKGVAEGSLETDNMVSHIGQVIQSIYPRGGDKNTYMKLVAQEMPRIVKANPKLFRRAFGMAYDRFFHIDQDDDFDYTDYSMRQGERGMAEEKQKGVDGKACWKGYKRMGTKKKGGKTVDNCVPIGEGLEQRMKALIAVLESKHKK